MNQDIYSRSVTILKQFTSQTNEEYLILYEPSNVSPYDRVSTLKFYGYITALRATVDISSLTESELPDLSVTQSRTERLVAVREMEWNSPRYELEFYLQTTRQPATFVGAISLLNRNPFYQVNLLPYFTEGGVLSVGNDARILGRVRNVGYGLLRDSDKVSIFGCAKEEITTLPSEERTIQFGQAYNWTVGTTSQQIIGANADRLQLTLVNRGTTGIIYLNYGAIAQAEKGIVLNPNGGTYEINLTNPYQGAISAIGSQAGCLLSGLEGV